MKNGALSLALACGCLSATRLPAEEWSSFRGASGSGLVQDATLPTHWTLNKHVIWKTKLPGTGWSQPVAWGKNVFVTAAEADEQPKPDPNNLGPGPGAPGLLGFLTGSGSGREPPKFEHRWLLLCLDANSGDVLWERAVREGRPTIPIHANNTYASETPATDGERVVAYFGMLGVWCYDYSGNLLWQRDLKTYPTQFDWGTGSSPVLFGDRVFIQCDNEQASYLAALDKRTGDDVWRRDRQEKSNWSTPYLW